MKRGIRAVPLVLAGLLVGATAARADERWAVGVGGEVQLNPRAPDDGSSTVAVGGSVQVLRAVGARTWLGVRLEVLRLFPHAETHEDDTTQQDLVVALRRGRPRADRPTLGFDVGLGVTRYAGRVDIPEEPGCVGCGRYRGVTYRPTVQAGLDVDVPLGGGWAMAPRARAVVTPVRAEKLDVYNFVPGAIGVRFDVVVVRRW